MSTEAGQGPTREPGATGARPSAGKLLAIIGGVVTLLTIVFSVTIFGHHKTYRTYRAQTLDAEDAAVPWRDGEVSVEGCVDFAIRWTMDCPGIAPWCEAEVPVVMETCLASSDRAAYCDEVGDEVLSTRFGFEACKSARDDKFGPHEGCRDPKVEADRYACRSFKKYCAGAYRAIASHCRARNSDAATTP